MNPQASARLLPDCARRPLGVSRANAKANRERQWYVVCAEVLLLALRISTYSRQTCAEHSAVRLRHGRAMLEAPIKLQLTRVIALRFPPGPERDS